ncbi:MAG: hypothetical protein ABII76_24715 [Pseudomonadota bacterium]
MGAKNNEEVRYDFSADVGKLVSGIKTITSTAFGAAKALGGITVVANQLTQLTKSIFRLVVAPIKLAVSAIRKAIELAARAIRAVIHGAMAAVRKSVQLAIDGFRAYSQAIAEAAKTGDEFAKAAKRIGISTELYSQWRHVLEMSGGEAGDLETAVRTLTRVVNDSESGLAEATRTIDALGLEIYDTAGNMRDLGDLFHEALYALSLFENNTQRAAIAQEIFGRSALRLLPLLDRDLNSVYALANEARRLGFVWSTSSGQLAERVVDNMTRIKNIFAAVKRYIFEAFGPAVAATQEWMIGLWAQHREAIEGFVHRVQKSLQPWIEWLQQSAADAFAYIAEEGWWWYTDTLIWLYDLRNQSGLTWAGIRDTAVAAWTAIHDAVQTTIDKIAEVWALYGEARAAGASPIQSLSTAITSAFDFKAIFADIMAVLQPMLSRVWEIIKAGWAASKPWIKAAIEWVVEIVKGAISRVVKEAKAAAGGWLLGTAANIGESIRGATAGSPAAGFARAIGLERWNPIDMLARWGYGAQYMAPGYTESPGINLEKGRSVTANIEVRGTISDPETVRKIASEAAEIIKRNEERGNAEPMGGGG